MNTFRADFALLKAPIRPCISTGAPNAGVSHRAGCAISPGVGVPWHTAGVPLPRDRWIALGLGTAAIALVAVPILATQERHIYLFPLAHPFLGVALAAAVSAVAARFGVARRRPRIGMQVTATVVGLAALLLGGATASFTSSFDPSRLGIVTTSPDFAVVSYRVPVLFQSSEVVLRIQSRNGPASRESDQALACFIEATSGAGPEWLFDRALFTGRDEVEVIARDGTAWPVHFDPRTLRPVHPLDRCAGAPDIAGD
jgi:hypothetical protein